VKGQKQRTLIQQTLHSAMRSVCLTRDDRKYDTKWGESRGRERNAIAITLAHTNVCNRLFHTISLCTLTRPFFYHPFFSIFRLSTVFHLISNFLMSELKWKGKKRKGVRDKVEKFRNVLPLPFPLLESERPTALEYWRQTTCAAGQREGRALRKWTDNLKCISRGRD